MGMFSGAGGRGLAFGLADAMHQIPIEQDRKAKELRANTRQDEEDQQRRDEITSKSAQQKFENTRQTAADARETETHGLQVQGMQHTLARAPIEDAHSDTTFGLNKQLTQGKIDSLPLERAHLRAEIASAGSAQESQELQRELTQLEITAHHMDLSKKQAEVAGGDAIKQSELQDSAQPLFDHANQHLLPPGKSVDGTRNKDGSWTVSYYADAPVAGPTGYGQTQHQLVSQQKFGSTADVRDEFNTMLHHEEVYKSQLAGQTKFKYTPMRDDQNNLVNYNSHDGKVYNEDMTPFKGKLSPTSNQAMDEILHPEKYQSGGMNAGQPVQTPGMGQQVAPAGPPSWMQLGDGTSGQP